MAQINIRIDDDLKEKGEELFKSLGLTFSSAVSLFVSQCVKEGGIPFSITTKVDKSNQKEISNFYNMLYETYCKPDLSYEENYEIAKKITTVLGNVSPGILQRAMKIGINKAMGFIDRMEDEAFIEEGYEEETRKIIKAE